MSRTAKLTFALVTLFALLCATDIGVAVAIAASDISDDCKTPVNPTLRRIKTYSEKTGFKPLTLKKVKTSIPKPTPCQSTTAKAPSNSNANAAWEAISVASATGPDTHTSVTADTWPPHAFVAPKDYSAASTTTYNSSTTNYPQPWYGGYAISLLSASTPPAASVDTVDTLALTAIGMLVLWLVWNLTRREKAQTEVTVHRIHIDTKGKTDAEIEAELEKVMQKILGDAIDKSKDDK